MAAREPVPVRSYRAVVDDVERRIYRIDRWRLPLPGGIEVRAILYTLAAFVAISVFAGFPVVERLVGTLPVGIRYLALPVLAGWALAAWRIDGRAPHHALAGLVRYTVKVQTLAGLRPTRAIGSQLPPIAALQVAPSGDEARYRRGRVRGPARITLRYPARLELERSVANNGEEASQASRRVQVTAAGERLRPLATGRELRVPPGSEVRFR